MKEIGKIVLHIPAREGSKRVPKKNLRLMNGKPMISYVIEAVLNSKITENSYVNTDSDSIIEYVKNNYSKIKIYHREKELCSDTAKSDDFNADIIRKLHPDTLIMINPVCPLIEASDIINAVDEYIKSDCDTLITSNSTKMQTFCDGVPVNISIDEALKPSQYNPIVTTLNWAITIWDAKKFLKRIEQKGFAVWGEKIKFYDIDLLKSIKVSYEEDFIVAEKMLKLKEIDI